jgi:hypothetical protein
VSEKKCGTCRFWGWRGDSGTYRRCVAVEMDDDGATNDGVFERLSVERRESALKFRADHPAVVEDREDYYAALRTSALFGCVLHEEKE